MGREAAPRKQNIPLACDMSAFAAEQRERQGVLGRWLRDDAMEIRDLDDGYAFAHPPDGHALLGLDDTLGLAEGESVMIFGAGGGLGHLAVQLAKRMGVRVFAVASGEDGVALAERLGADATVNGREHGVAAAVREFAPDGLDAALLTAGGEAAERALETLRDGGRVAYPRGVQPEPEARPGVAVKEYVGDDAGPEAFERLNRLIASGPFEVHVARTFPLEQAAEAHRALDGHYLGKLALRPSRRRHAG